MALTQRFEQALWYYQTLAKEFKTRSVPALLADELYRTVEMMEQVAG